ncbi:MAG: glycosyltransferase family 9 protein [Gemmatimonadota bacterium]
MSASSDLAFERWLEYMRSGDFESGWRVADEQLPARRTDPTLPRHRQSIWNGSPLDGRRVLIRCYHGLGDTIHFIRYLPHAGAVASEVTLWVQPELLPLLENFGTSARLLPLHDGVPAVAYDVDAELMELPHIFRTTLETVPCTVPYLHAEPAPIERGEELQVGLVWRAGDWDERRSVPFAELAPLFEIPGVRFHILQRGSGLAEWKPGCGVLSGCDALAEAARVIKALDLVITIDSMPAHLAGALAVPVWILLHADPDWRWLRERSDTPWYPTARLFRQRIPSDWSGVIAEVAAQLRIRAG